MSNHIFFVATKFTDEASGHVAYGYRAFDDYVKTYANCWDAAIVDDKALLHAIIEEDDDAVSQLIDHMLGNECGCRINDTDYSFKQIAEWMREFNVEGWENAAKDITFDICATCGSSFTSGTLEFDPRSPDPSGFDLVCGSCCVTPPTELPEPVQMNNIGLCYTVGDEKTYDFGIAKHGADFLKVGVTSDYSGGICFGQVAEAIAYIKKVGKIGEWAVYVLDADLFTDTKLTHGQRFLQRDARIVSKAYSTKD